MPKSSRRSWKTLAPKFPSSSTRRKPVGWCITKGRWRLRFSERSVPQAAWWDEFIRRDSFYSAECRRWSKEWTDMSVRVGTELSVRISDWFSVQRTVGDAIITSALDVRAVGASYSDVARWPEFIRPPESLRHDRQQTTGRWRVRRDCFFPSSSPGSMTTPGVMPC